MPQNEPQRAPRAAVLLDAVHAALLGADFAALPGLSRVLAQELDHPTGPVSPGDLQVIRRKAERNAACLLAARRGIKAAQHRLSEIRTTTGGLVTYDRSGKRAEVRQSQILTQRF